MGRSAARRFAMGALNVTTTGCATPTPSPGVGRTGAIVNLDDWFAAARLTRAGLATTVAATTVTARRQRTTARMVRPLLLDTVPIGIVGATKEWKRKGAFAIRSRLGHVSTTGFESRCDMTVTFEETSWPLYRATYPAPALTSRSWG